MRQFLAWHNLRHRPGRTALAVSGIAIALVLIFMQRGFLGAVEATATQIYDKFEFDLVLLSSEYVDLNEPDSFPQERLRLAGQEEGVARAVPLTTSFSLWKYPDASAVGKDADNKGNRESILVLAYRVGDPVFRESAFGETAGDFADAVGRLDRPDSVLMDRLSAPEFGVKPGAEPGTDGVIAETELGGVTVRVVGRFTIGAGFSAKGLLITGVRTLSKAVGYDVTGRPKIGLIQLKPGADPEEVAARLRRNLPEDVQVKTREGLRRDEREHWVSGTAVGSIFAIGVAVALVVGVVFTYQMMAADVTEQLPEYATLKAIGYRGGYLSWVVLQQALILAVAGYVPAFFIAKLLYALTRSLQQIPIEMTAQNAVFVLLLSVGMCAVSGMFALRRLHTHSPADLFR